MNYKELLERKEKIIDKSFEQFNELLIITKRQQTDIEKWQNAFSKAVDKLECLANGDLTDTERAKVLYALLVLREIISCVNGEN